MMITAVPREALRVVWGDVARVLNKSVETSKGKFHIDDVYKDVESGMYGLWLIIDDEKEGMNVIAAITTRIIQYPSRKALAMDWLGGSRMGEWLPMAQKTLKEYAKECGCSHLEGYGRKAWKRWLGKYGWEPEYIAYRMELENG
jgi:hypothetical protein